MVLSRAITQIEAEVSHERERNEEPSQEAARPPAQPAPAAPPAARSLPDPAHGCCPSRSASQLLRPVPTSQ